MYVPFTSNDRSQITDRTVNVPCHPRYTFGCDAQHARSIVRTSVQYFLLHDVHNSIHMRILCYIVADAYFDVGGLHEKKFNIFL